jgi:hypothetical protein
VHEILKKVIKNCLLKAIILHEKGTKFITEYSPDYFLVLTLINDTFYQITQSFNQMKPGSLFTVMEVGNKISFTQFHCPGNISEDLKLNI